MNLLLDTHTFLWFIDDNLKLSDRLKNIIEDTNNISYLSIASLWEMSIKFNLGKLTLDPNYEDFVEREIVTSTIQLLNIELKHIRVNSTLPFHHRDPFDRLIIAQSIVEEMPIVSVDSAFNKYSATLIN